MCLVMLHLLVITPGLKKQPTSIANKRKGQTHDQNLYHFPLSNPLSPDGFWASLVLSTILSPWNYPLFAPIIKFKKVAVLEPKIKPMWSIITHAIYIKYIICVSEIVAIDVSFH